MTTADEAEISRLLEVSMTLSKQGRDIEPVERLKRVQELIRATLN